MLFDSARFRIGDIIVANILNPFPKSEVQQILKWLRVQVKT